MAEEAEARWKMLSEMPVGGENTQKVEIVNPKNTGARILVKLEPAEKMLSLPRPKTARQLLEALGLEEEEALVARDGKLLTPDRRIWPDDSLLVRVVGSVG